MVQKYKIEGMTCGGCVATVKQALENLEVVESADIQLEAPQGKLTLKHSVQLSALQEAIGKYQISEIESPKEEKKTEVIDLPEKSITTYKPLLLIIGFIAGVSLLVQYPFDDFSGILWMRFFMAGFFIVFAFFKLLNLEGFAMSYRMYDIVAAKWKGWGYIYPFVELLLGILFLINIAPIFTNVATILILGISSIGVIRSVLDKQKIKCACLGDVFNLPMSTVTIVEDLSMVAMSAIMLVLM
ncbi:cation transporter [Saprospiraceae bacterium]|jgi:copper chaperone CopZ|nr:cation transporter [Saprospiraceae bacterium]